jgi:hypothetical protein
MEEPVSEEFVVPNEAVAEPYAADAACGHMSEIPEDSTSFLELADWGRVPIPQSWKGEATKLSLLEYIEHPRTPLFMNIGPKVLPELEPIRFVGEVYQEVTWQGVDEEGYYMAELMVVRFNMTSDHPQLGHLIINVDASRPGNKGSLKSVNPGNPFPVIHTTCLHVTATSSVLPGEVLQNYGPPLCFVSDPSPSWPPIQTIYTLPVNVQFQSRRVRGPAVATVSRGSVLVGTTEQLSS